MVFNAGEEYTHGVGAIVQEGDAGSVQVIGQLVDISLQLSKGYEKRKDVLKKGCNTKNKKRGLQRIIAL